MRSSSGDYPLIDAPNLKRLASQVPRDVRDGDSHAAYAAAAWLKRAGLNGSCTTFLNPPLCLFPVGTSPSHNNFSFRMGFVFTELGGLVAGGTKT
jgi:hypothetical protein